MVSINALSYIAMMRFLIIHKCASLKLLHSYMAFITILTSNRLKKALFPLKVCVYCTNFVILRTISTAKR